jgi:hypothetical protein
MTPSEARMTTAADARSALPAWLRRLALVMVLALAAPLASDIAGAPFATAALADDDDDDDDDRPRRRIRIERVQPRPAPEARRPAARGAEIVALLPLGTAPALLEAEGFQILARTTLAAPPRDMLRLRTTRRESAQAALRRLQAVVPAAIADLNRIYRPSRLDCSVAGCASFAMVGWPSPPRSCAVETTIGMIDTAVHASHSAFRAGGVETVTLRREDRRPSSERHGTAIAALLVGQSDGAFPGLLPRARLVAVDVFHRGADGRDAADIFDLVRGLDLLAGRGIRLANLSLAGPESPILREAVEAAVGKGMILVAAAGNEGPRARPVYPAAYRNVIAVTAVDRDGRVFRRANRGAHIAFAAPGVNMILAGAEARPQSGTSLAVPFVTAAAALALAGGTSPSVIVERLRRSSSDLGVPGHDPETGWGLVRMPGGCD